MVTFGAWDLESLTVPNTIDPLDRFPNLAPRTRNFHHLLPRESKIKAGGSVNFVISGFHLLLVYDNGVEPGDIDITSSYRTGRRHRRSSTIPITASTAASIPRRS